MARSKIQNGSGDNGGGAPRWVWMTGIILGVAVLILVVAALATGGDHGPGRHEPDNFPRSHSADASAASVERPGPTRQ